MRAPSHKFKSDDAPGTAQAEQETSSTDDAESDSADEDEETLVRRYYAEMSQSKSVLQIAHNCKLSALGAEALEAFRIRQHSQEEQALKRYWLCMFVRKLCVILL